MRLLQRLLLLILVFFSLGAHAQIEDDIPARPSPPRLVNDFTKAGNFLTPEQKDALERKLVAYDDSTSNQVAVVIVETLNGHSAGDYATALGRKWGVGGKDNSNGVVILISTGGGDGNRDAFIAVGYGLEGVITDFASKSIVENEIIANFKAGNYYRGLDEAADAIAQAAAGKYKAPAGYGVRGKNSFPKIWTIIGIIAFIILSAMFGGNGGSGTYVSRGGFGSWTGGSGGGGGGGFSGGGFGGFGGGSFGGGGAGGKW